MSSIHRILAPVDFSDSSVGAVSYAHCVAAQLRCDLTLVHVLEPIEAWFSPVHITPVRLDEMMAERSSTAQREMDRFLDKRLDGRCVKHLRLTGDPAEQILQCVESEKASLILMPTHGYDPIRRFLLGSVTSKVLHGAHVPVWTAVHFDKYTSGTCSPPRHIVCGLDLGPQSARVLEWAAEMAQQFAAKLTVVHATPEMSGTEADLARQNWQDMLNTRLRKQVASTQHPALEKAEVMLAHGEPHKALGETVERAGADLLVIGRGASADGPFGRLRAHAYAIVRASPCPIVSV